MNFEQMFTEWWDAYGCRHFDPNGAEGAARFAFLSGLEIGASLVIQRHGKKIKRIERAVEEIKENKVSGPVDVQYFLRAFLEEQTTQPNHEPN
jgi:hypothetical protein